MEVVQFEAIKKEPVLSEVPDSVAEERRGEDGREAVQVPEMRGGEMNQSFPKWKRGEVLAHRFNEFEKRRHIVEVEYPRALELNKQFLQEFRRLRDIIRILKGKKPLHSSQIVEIPVYINTDEDVEKKMNQHRNMFNAELKQEKRKERVKVTELFRKRLEKRLGAGLSGEQYRGWFLKTIDNDLVQLQGKKQLRGVKK